MSEISKAFDKLRKFYPEGSVFLVLEREQADSIVAQAIAQHNRELVEKVEKLDRYEYEDGFYRGMAPDKDGEWLSRDQVINLLEDK